MTAVVTTKDDLVEMIAAGLAGRLRSQALVLDRLDRLESGSGGWLAASAQSELPEAALAMTLRAWGTAVDPTNFRILQALAAEESLAISRLQAACGLGRLVMSERLNDLVQVGLAVRLIDTDHVQRTAVGVALVELITAVAGETAVRFQNSWK